MMGQILFWLEAATTSVLLVALIWAILARPRRRRWLLMLLLVPWLLITPLGWALTIGAFTAVQVRAGGAMFPMVCSWVAGALFLAASIIVIKRARRRASPAELPQAARWRLNRVALAFGGALLLTCMTFWNLDLAARQKIATTRVETGALALSVAPPRIPDSQNAAPLYKQAWETLDAQAKEGDKWSDAVGDWLRPDKGQFDPNNKAMLAFLSQQKPVIDLLHQASQRPGCNFGVEYYPPSVSTLMPSLGEFRALVRFLSLSSRVKAHQGHVDDAMKDLNVCFAMVEHCTQDPTLIATLVAMVIEEEAFGTLQYAFDRGNLTADGLSMLNLNPWLSFNSANHRSMLMERAFGLSVFGAPQEIGYVVPVDNPMWPYAIAPYRVFLWANDVAAYDGWMQRLERLSSQPYYQSRPEWLHNATPEASQAVGGLMSSILTPSLSKAAEQAAIADARHRLALLGVAMWRYRLDHGSFPSDLKLLVPNYTLSASVDPFTGKPMKMIRKGDGQVVIYSVGPNATDDGGQELQNLAEWTDRTKPRKGDIAMTLR